MIIKKIKLNRNEVLIQKCWMCSSAKNFVFTDTDREYIYCPECKNFDKASDPNLSMNLPFEVDWANDEDDDQTTFIICPTCNGDKQKWDKTLRSMVNCSRCNGLGKVEIIAI